MGDMFPILQSPGRDPSLSDVWNNMHNGFAIAVANSLSILGCIPSGPGDLLGLSLCIYLVKSVSVIWISLSLEMLFFISGSGIFCVSSFVKTLEKKLFRTSAFSSSVIVSFPSGLVRSESGCRVFSLELTYFQKRVIFHICGDFFFVILHCFSCFPSGLISGLFV